MKILFIGDPHIKLSNLDVAERMFDYALKVAVDYHCDHICDLGDTFDNYALMQSQAIRLYLDFAGKVSKAKMSLIKIIGNHDYETQDCKHHVFGFLKWHDSVMVVESPSRHGNVLYLPFYRDKDKFKEVVERHLASECHKDVKYLVCHQGFNGYDYGNGFIAVDDANLPDNRWGFQRIISGHFHKPSDIYVGTPFSHSFGESNQEKRFAILDTTSNDFKYIPVVGLPKHITIEAVCQGGSEGGVEGSVDYRKPDFDIVDADKVRVVVSGTREQQTYITDKEVKKEFGKSVSVRRILVSSDNQIEIKETMNQAEMLRSYFKIKNIDNERVLKKALGYLESVRA